MSLLLLKRSSAIADRSQPAACLQSVPTVDVNGCRFHLAFSSVFKGFRYHLHSTIVGNVCLASEDSAWEPIWQAED